MGQNSFTTKERLKKNKLIRDVFDKGGCIRQKSIAVFLLKRAQGDDVNRVSFVVSKNLYNKKPVLRNRLRRILRESYRRTKHMLVPSYDIVILATNLKKGTKSTNIEYELKDAFKRYVKK